jgi:hypothetical protein
MLEVAQKHISNSIASVFIHCLGALDEPNEPTFDVRIRAFLALVDLTVYRVPVTSSFAEHRRRTHWENAWAIHPFGFGALWSEADADLSSAVVISLSASSKTGRRFYWELARNRDVDRHGPIALLQLTSVPDALWQYESNLPAKAAFYDDVGVITWVEQSKPERIVVVDFGASNAVLKKLADSASNIAANVTVVGVGYEAKVYSQEEIQARMASGITKVPVNTSGIRDKAIEAQGAFEYNRGLDES